MHRDMNRDEFLFWKFLERDPDSLKEVTVQGLHYVVEGLNAVITVNREKVKTQFFIDFSDSECFAERHDYWESFNFDSYLAWIDRQNKVVTQKNID